MGPVVVHVTGPGNRRTDYVHMLRMRFFRSTAGALWTSAADALTDTGQLAFSNRPASVSGMNRVRDA